MRVDRSWLAFLMLLAVGCGATRHVQKPTSPQGYTHIEVRDIAPMALEDLNVEVEGQLGPIITNERCDTLLIPLIASTRAAVMNGQVSLTMMSGDLTLSLPRARYPEVRDPHGGSQVRVRGYLSPAISESCGTFLYGSGHYLWVDTIAWQAPSPGAVPQQPTMIPPPPAR